ncbi:MAG: hypothetical protein FWG66_00710 [Spirochaetes bacterium]|nr:hypothetical protein [Spirochaetota bacterium]
MSKCSFNQCFPKTEKIEIRLRQDLADRLPKEQSKRNALVNRAVKNEFERVGGYPMSTKAVAGMESCEISTANKWAAANGVAQNARREYLWPELDIARFRERPPPGRRWPEKEDG